MSHWTKGMEAAVLQQGFVKIFSTLIEFLPTKSERNTYVLVCRGNLPTVFEGITYCMQYL